MCLSTEKLTDADRMSNFFPEFGPLVSLISEFADTSIAS
jgi:hypothetical protein